MRYFLSKKKLNGEIISIRRFNQKSKVFEYMGLWDSRPRRWGERGWISLTMQLNDLHDSYELTEITEAEAALVISLF